MPRYALVLALGLAGTGAASAGELVIRSDPPEVRLGQGDVAQLLAVMDGMPVQARWLTQVGAVRGGRWDAEGRRAPGVAIVAAEAKDATGGPVRGALIVPLIGAGTLPTHTSPGAEVTVVIGARTYGPMTADASGEVLVPVEVEAGDTQAVVRALDTRGLTTERTVDLPRAEWARALVVAPEGLEVGQTGLVTVFAVGPDGQWLAGERPDVTLGAGLEAAGPVADVGPGRWDLPVRAVAAGDTEVVAAIDGEPARARTTITAAPIVIPPVRAPLGRWFVEAGPLFAGGQDAQIGLGAAVVARLGPIDARVGARWLSGLAATDAVGTVDAGEVDLGAGATWIGRGDLAVGARLGFWLRRYDVTGVAVDDRAGSAVRWITAVAGSIEGRARLSGRVFLEGIAGLEIGLENEKFAIDDVTVLEIGRFRGMLTVGVLVTL